MHVLLSTRFINIVAALATGALLFAHAGRAQAGTRMIVRVSISEQSMQVLIDGRSAFRWPTGTFKPTRMHRMWYSRKYDNAPMPH